MNIETYSEIIEKRGFDPLEKTHSSRDAFTRAQLSFRQDLVHGKVVWTDKMCNDFLCYLSNNHPLVSIFFAPVLHPYSRQERIVVLLCITSFAVMWASMANAAAENGPGMEYVISIIGGIFNSIFNKFLKSIATCSCVQQCHPLLRKCCECIGHCTMCLWTVISICVFIIGLTNAAENIGEFILSFIISLFSGWIFSFITLFVLFICAWKREHNIYRLQKNPFVISCFDYAEFQQNIPFSRKKVPGLNKEEQKQMIDYSKKQYEMSSPGQGKIAINLKVANISNSAHINSPQFECNQSTNPIELQTQQISIPSYLTNTYVQQQQPPLYQIQQQSPNAQQMQIANNIQQPITIIQVNAANLPSLLNQLNNNQNIFIQQQQQPSVQMQSSPQIPVIVVPTNNNTENVINDNNQNNCIYGYANTKETVPNMASPERSEPKIQQREFMYTPKKF